MNSERIIRTKVESDFHGCRLDHYLSRRFNYLSRNQWQEIIKSGGITINKANRKSSYKLKTGDTIEFTPDTHEPSVDKTFEIIYDDEYIMGINKNGNLPCHPAGPFFKNTLWYELIHGNYGLNEVHFINRIDRETSGVVIIAKSAEIAKKMSHTSYSKEDLFERKLYQVLVFGEFPDATTNAEGFLYNDSSISIGDHERVRKKRIFTEKPPPQSYDECRTIFRKLDSFCIGEEQVSFLEAELFTGRMHQIRATLCSMGFPLLGDKLYGPDESIFIRFIHDKMSEEDRKKLIIPRQALHSAETVLTHPVTSEKITIKADLPEDINQYLNLIPTYSISRNRIHYYNRKTSVPRPTFTE